MRSIFYKASALTFTFFLLTAIDAAAQGYANGNRLALDYQCADNAVRRRLREERVGKPHSFRYLKIIDIKKDCPQRPRRIYLLTVEPSSDMEIAMLVSARNSLRLAQTLEVGDAVAADGRIADLGLETQNRMLLQPVRLNFKDRDSPKLGPELLREVDPGAH